MNPKNLATSTVKSPAITKRTGSSSVPPLAIFTEMFELLEAYGPLWYSEDLHNRASRALARLEKMRGFSLIQGRTSEKRSNSASMKVFTDSQSGICTISTTAKSSFPES
jgi:hypothetical protein